MFLTQPAPKTVEDLRQEISEDSLLELLEKQQALREEAIRTHNSDALVVGAPPQDTAQDSEEDDDGSVDPDAAYDSADEGGEDEQQQ